MTYEQWRLMHPAAAADLEQMHNAVKHHAAPEAAGKTETFSQQAARFSVSKQGAFSWRNNVGATPAKCKKCQAPQQPVRYGLSNDSKALNEKFKSSDLILLIPRLITPAMVGTTIGQFGAIETKRPGWKFSGKGQEPGQANWLGLVNRYGGFATFSTGDVTL